MPHVERNDYSNKLTFQNGITDTDDVIDLGGALLKATTIDGAQNSFSITDLSELLLGVVTTISPGFPASPYDVTKSISADGTSIQFSVSEGKIPGNQILINISPTGITLSSPSSLLNEGFSYVDRPTTFNPETLPDVQYVEDNRTAANTDYDNTTSGLVAIEVQSAIDEVEDRVDTAETIITDISPLLVSIVTDYNLPASASQGTGLIRIVNRSGSEYSVIANGADTIEGEASQIIYDGETFDLRLIGTNWVI